MKQILTISFLFFTLSAIGQKESISIQGGLNTSFITNNQVTILNERLAPAGGINYDVILQKNILLGFGLHYAPRGFDYDFNYTDETGSFMGTATIHYNYDYLIIPLRIGFVSGKKVKFIPSIALVPSVLASAKINLSGYVDPFLNESFNDKELVSPFSDFEIGLMLGTEFEFPISSRMSLFPSVSFYHSITSFYGWNVNIKQRHWSVFAGLGLKYHLKDSESL